MEKPSKRSVEGQATKDDGTLFQETVDTPSAGQQETMSANDASDLILADVEETGTIENKNIQKTDVEDCSEELLCKRKPRNQNSEGEVEEKTKEIQMPKVLINMKIYWRIGKELVFIKNTNGCTKTDANDEVKSLNVDEPDQMLPKPNFTKKLKNLVTHEK